MSGAILVVALLALFGCGATADNPQPASTQAAIEPTVTAAGVFPEGLAPAPVLGIVVDSHLKVVDVEAGSAAEHAGIKRGDVLTKLAGTRVTTAGDAMSRARQSISANEAGTVTVTLQRGAQEVTLPVHPAPPAAPGSNDHPAPTPTAVPADYGYL